MLTIAVAILGASLGVLGEMYAAHHLRGANRVPWVGAGAGPGGRPPLRNVLPRLARALDLTPEQLKRIEPKVLASQKEFEAARESLRSRIDAELTPAQRERLRSLERERDRHHNFPNDHGGDPGRSDRH